MRAEAREERRARSRVLMLGVAVLASVPAVAAEPYYADDGLQVAWRDFDDVPSATIRKRLRDVLFYRRVREIVRLDASGATLQTFGLGALAKLTRSEVLALLTVIAQEPELFGAERDVLVSESPSASIPVTIRWNERTRIKVQAGPAWRAPVAVARPEELAERFGVGPLGGTRGGWEPEALGRLAAALELLTPRENELVRGIEYWRTEAPSQRARDRHREWRTILALYARTARQAQVFVYDLVLTPPDDFVGDPDAPRPSCLLTILHEIGHAIEDAPARQAQARALALEVDLNQRSAPLVARWEALYRAAADPEGRVDEATFAQLEQWKAEMDALTSAGQAALDALAAYLDGYHPNSPVVRLYLEAAGEGAIGPTPYGRTDASEGFAEAFALHHADPAALRRAMPGVADWFEAGGHLKAVDEAIAAIPKQPPEASQP